MSSLQTPVRDRLRTATAPFHDALHRHPMVVALLDGAVGVPDYRGLLSRLYGVVAPLEDELELVRHQLDGELRQALRSRAWLLVRDLRALGLSGGGLARIARKADIEGMVTTEDALGTLYVLQGSAIGGKAIAQRLRRAGVVEMPRQYFEGRPDDPETWRLCCNALERCAQEGDVDRLTMAARTAFRHVALWLDAVPAERCR
jgi:heme oxygenase